MRTTCRPMCRIRSDYTATSRLLACVSDIDRKCHQTVWKWTLVRRNSSGWALVTRQQFAKLNMSPPQIKNQAITPSGVTRQTKSVTSASLSTATSASWPWSRIPPMWSVAASTKFANYGVSFVRWQLMLDAHSLLPCLVANRVDYWNAVMLYGTSIPQSHASYRRYWMPPLVWSLVSANTSTLRRCFVTLFTGCQSLRGYSSRLCPRWSCLPQASHLPSLGLATSVTPFCWPRRPFRFAGKHVHRSFSIAAPVLRGSEHTSTWPPFTARHNSRPQFRSKLKTSDKPIIWYCMIPLRTLLKSVTL